MADSDITRLDYGGKIATDAARMAAGMIEMFDEMADLALSRIIALGFMCAQLRVETAISARAWRVRSSPYWCMYRLQAME